MKILFMIAVCGSMNSVGILLAIYIFFMKELKTIELLLKNHNHIHFPYQLRHQCSLPLSLAELFWQFVLLQGKVLAAIIRFYVCR
ncbi:Integrin alpha-8 [Frankliniella fusca]|uniref:Integrin alpha-8 n=1 Tax=Frankliniella fusca TaxID=407009 RepID=A0AAE1I133_9NEOP|nr:Integrin alpha-8 [Frankliniella fusca]